MGSLMLFWPTTYWRWARWSKTDSIAPSLTRGWDEGHREGRWGLKIVGIGMMLFGVTATILTVWIRWFQR